MHWKWPGCLLKAVTISSEHSGDWKFAEKSGKNDSETRTFSGQKRPFFAIFLARQPKEAATLSTVLGSSLACFTQSWAPGGRGLDQNHFESKSSHLALLFILLVLIVSLAWKCNFEALI